MRVIKDGRSEKLRNELLFSGFEFASISSSELTDTLNVREYFVYEKLEKQRADLSKALDSIGIDSEKSREAINGFFDKAKILSQKVSEKRYAPTPELMFEAAINRFAIRRFEQLVSKIQKNNNNTGLTKKFSSFIGDLNTFFADSRKEAKIDAIGLLKFETATKEEITPEQLSSGEQQLLVMFSHLHFNGFGDKSNVFVFDEPEVSLHLRWQELLLPRMLNSSPRAQIIVATHSPEIVGELLDHCVDINSD
jgi:predicted ATP-dependent endonuclease of OLD family